jgi:hypothetical protein
MGGMEEADMDDPRDILRAAGIEVPEEVEKYAEHRVEQIHAFLGAGRMSPDDPHEAVASSVVDPAIVALARLVVMYQNAVPTVRYEPRDGQHITIVNGAPGSGGCGGAGGGSRGDPAAYGTNGKS